MPPGEYDHAGRAGNFVSALTLDKLSLRTRGELVAGYSLGGLNALTPIESPSGNLRDGGADRSSDARTIIYSDFMSLSGVFRRRAAQA